MIIVQMAKIEKNVATLDLWGLTNAIRLKSYRFEIKIKVYLMLI
jgi:hypothetical protein